MSQLDYYQNRIKEELAARCDRNPRYSIRAFAKALGLDAGTLSKVLSGKQIPSFKLSERILETLALNPDENDLFLTSVAERQKRRGLERLSPLLREVGSTGSRPTELGLDLYRILADWHHFAILELTYVKGFKPNPSWIGKELGISTTEAKLAVERMLDFGLLELTGGALRKTNARLSSADKHLTAPALKKNQRQFLEKALESLENDPLEERSHTSMTMAIDEKKLPLAKKMIREFNQKLCRFLEDGTQTRVYNLEIALSPLQKKNAEPAAKARSSKEKK